MDETFWDYFVHDSVTTGFIRGGTYVLVSFRLRCQESNDDLFEREILYMSSRWLEHNVVMQTPLETEPSVRRFVDDLKCLFIHFTNETKPVVENIGEIGQVHRLIVRLWNVILSLQFYYKIVELIKVNRFGNKFSKFQSDQIFFSFSLLLPDNKEACLDVNFRL